MPLPKLTQPELVEELAEETGWTNSDVRRFLAGLMAVIENNVSQGYRIQVAGILVEPRLRKAQKSRMGRNPQTGEAVKIAAKPATVRLKARPVAPLSRVSLPSPKKLAGMV
jgi:nucleoid DNA-binding protein